MPAWLLSSRSFLVAFAVWGLLGLTWAVASPQFSVPDEPAHVMRAVSVAGGQILGERSEYRQTEPVAIDAVIYEVEVPQAFTDIGNIHDCFAPFRATAECAMPLAPAPGHGVAFTTAGAYQPLFYGLLGLPARVSSPVRAVYAARLISVVIGALLLAGATVTARAGGAGDMSSVSSLPSRRSCLTSLVRSIQMASRSPRRLPCGWVCRRYW